MFLLTPSSSCVWQVETLEGALQSTTHQVSRLKWDLRGTQQEKDALRQEVLSLHKRLQNADNKVVVETKANVL